MQYAWAENNVLLHEHDTDSNMRPPPASPSKAISPRDDLELYTTYHSTILELRVPQRAGFPVESYLSSDVKPFLLNTGIGCRESSQFG